MKLVMIAGVAVLALAATAAFGQESSPPNTVGNGTSKALDAGPGHMVGKPVSPNTAGNEGISQRRKAIQMPQPGSVPQNGTGKPAGATGAPPYGSSTPAPNSSRDANKPPYGG